MLFLGQPKLNLNFQSIYSVWTTPSLVVVFAKSLVWEFDTLEYASIWRHGCRGLGRKIGWWGYGRTRELEEVEAAFETYFIIDLKSWFYSKYYWMDIVDTYSFMQYLWSLTPISKENYKSSWRDHFARPLIQFNEVSLFRKSASRIM